jgi:hypothetical protein
LAVYWSFSSGVGVKFAQSSSESESRVLEEIQLIIQGKGGIASWLGIQEKEQWNTRLRNIEYFPDFDCSFAFEVFRGVIVSTWIFRNENTLQKTLGAQNHEVTF